MRLQALQLSTAPVNSKAYMQGRFDIILLPLILDKRHKAFQAVMLSHCIALSLVMRKPAFCICENKDADQLRGNREADQCLCFRDTDSKSLSFLNPKKPLAIFCGCTARFVSGLVGNPEDRFSHSVWRHLAANTNGNLLFGLWALI